MDPPSRRRPESQIVTQGPQETEVVDAAVIKKSPVFNRSYGIHQVRRQFVKGDQAPLGAVLVGEPGDELWLQLISFQCLAAIAGDLADQTVVESDGGALLGVVGLRPRLNGDARVVERVGSHLRAVAIIVSAVARVAHFQGNRPRAQLLADAYFLRRGVDLRCLLEGVLQPLIHNVLILDVVVAEDRPANEKAQQQRATHRNQGDVAHRVF